MDPAPAFREMLWFWLKLGCVSFGGPTGHVAIMHAELVERKRWIGEERFLRGVNFCMLLPGPEATQLAIYCGWLLHGVRGGLCAGALFVLPAAILLWGLSWIYVAQGAVAGVAAVFHGLKPAVTAIVVLAAIRIGRRALKTRLHGAMAVVAFVAMFWGGAPFPAIVAAAAVVGWAWSLAIPGRDEDKVRPVQPGWAPGRSTLPAAIALTLAWWVPVFAAVMAQGPDGVLAELGLFFSRAAMVTFGGAYAVLPYVAEHAVGQQGWLSAAQMVDGLGLAEATPGPLIIVGQFVGFLAGWGQAGALSPIAMATFGAAITSWATFLPSFVLILLGAPYVERLGTHPQLGAALAAVMAAVVGVVLNLAVWFGWQVFFPRGGLAGGVDWFAVGLSVAALAALLRFKVSVVIVVLASGAVGFGWGWLTG
jgi:chromate transporter